jgi:4-hydroxybenzoate polyprenyltransferase
MKIVAYSSWTASAVFGAIVGAPFLLIFGARWFLGYLYSTKPFRLKRLPVISNLALGIVYCFTFLAGFLVAPAESWESFPLRLGIGFIVWFAFASEFKDIKDYEGDRIDGVRTLPGIFGLAKSKNLIGLMGMFGFLSVAFLYKEYLGILIWPTLGFGALYYFLVNAKIYREQPIIFTSLGFALVLFALSILKIIIP